MKKKTTFWEVKEWRAKLLEGYFKLLEEYFLYLQQLLSLAIPLEIEDWSETKKERNPREDPGNSTCRSHWRKLES